MASRVTDVEEFLRKSREEYTSDLERDRVDREEAEDDNSFANSTDLSKSQWKTEVKLARESVGRPVLQANKIPIYIQHVVNAGRQNKPAIKIGIGDGGVKETAEYFQSRIRHIEYECDADIAYDTARDHQVSSGRGSLRITTEYIKGTERQRACIEPIENQFSVTWGPHRKYDCSDAKRCWVVTRISKDQHRLEYGEDSLLNRTDFARESDWSDWVGVGERGDMVQIAEKFVVEEDGSVCRYVINGAEILKEGDWITDDIPIVPQWGRTATVQGLVRHFSLHNNAKDLQRLVNLYVSNIAENIAKQPKNRYKAAIGQIPANLEEDWSGNAPKGILYYTRFDGQGRDLGIPATENSEPPIQALSLGLQQSIEGIKAAMGIYDASLGQRSNETTGIAIERRKKEGEITNFHFPDNEARTRKRVGQILLKIIPLLDKPGSQYPVRHEDGKTELVPIGSEYEHPKTKARIKHVLTDGDYGVTVSTGPSYDSQREEQHENDAAMVQAAPELMWVIGDKLMGNSDAPDAEDRADRMKRAINMKTPGLIEDDDQQQQPIPPQVQQQLVAMDQKLKTTEAFAQSMHEKIANKQYELDNALRLKHMDIQSKQSEHAEDLAFKREELAEKSRVELAKLGLQADITRLESEIEVLKHEAGMAADKENAILSQTHEAGQAEADRQHQAEQATQAQDATAAQADAGRAHEAQQSDADRQAAADAAKASDQGAAE